MATVQSEILTIFGTDKIHHNVDDVVGPDIVFKGNVTAEHKPGPIPNRNAIHLQGFSKPVADGTVKGSKEQRQEIDPAIRKQALRAMIGAVFTCSTCSQASFCDQYQPEEVRVDLTPPLYDHGTGYVYTAKGFREKQADCLRVKTKKQRPVPRTISGLSSVNVVTWFHSQQVPTGIEPKHTISGTPHTIEGGVEIEYVQNGPHGDGMIYATSIDRYTNRITRHLPNGLTDESSKLLENVAMEAISERAKCQVCPELNRCNRLAESVPIVSPVKTGQRRLKGVRVWAYAATKEGFIPEQAGCLQVPTQSPQ